MKIKKLVSLLFLASTSTSALCQSIGYTQVPFCQYWTTFRIKDDNGFTTSFYACDRFGSSISNIQIANVGDLQSVISSQAAQIADLTRRLEALENAK